MNAIKFTQENPIGDTMLTLMDGRRMCASNVHARHERNRMPSQVTPEEALSVTQAQEPLSKQTRCIVLVNPSGSSGHQLNQSQKDTAEVYLTQVESSHLTLTGTAMGKLSKGDVIILSDDMAKLEDDNHALFRTAKVVSSMTSIEDNTIISHFKAYSSCRTKGSGGENATEES